VDAAKRDLDKVKGGPDPDDVAQAQAGLKSAQAQLESARASLSDLSLIAPFDGIVASNDLDVGEQVSPGAGTVSVANTSEWQVNTTDLSELNIVSVKEGQAVTVTFDAVPGLELGGKVLRIQSLGVNKQGDITYKVVVKLDQQDERLKWNMTALVTFQD
jgi:HlyD family secretion protein